MNPFFARSKYLIRCCVLLTGCVSGTAINACAQNFAPLTTYSTGESSGPEAVAVGDINGDGRLDIAVTTSNTIFNTASIGVLLGQSNGFSAVTSYSLGVINGYLSDVALGDVNGDGRLDIVSAFGLIGVQLGQVNGGFAPVTTYATSTKQSAAYRVVLGDVNQDGRLDIISANPNNNDVGVQLGQAGGFATVSTYSLGAGTHPVSIALGDINNDGRIDIMTADGIVDNTNKGHISALLGQASGGFALSTTYSASIGVSPEQIVLGDVDGDGYLDVVTANPGGNNTVSVLRRQASGGFATPVLYASGTTYTNNSVLDVPDVKLRDVNGDGRLDIIVSISANQFQNGVGVLLGQASGFQSAKVFFSSRHEFPNVAYPAGIAVGDVDGDGRADIITAVPFIDQVSVLRNTGTFLAATSAHGIAADLEFYPNPTHNGFTLHSLVGIEQVELYNSTGQVVRYLPINPTSGSTTLWVDVTALPRGLYNLRFRLGNQLLNKQVVVE